MLVFVFYVFQPPPMLFNRDLRRAGRGEPARGGVRARSSGVRRRSSAAIGRARDGGGRGASDDARGAFLASDTAEVERSAPSAPAVADVTGGPSYGDRPAIRRTDVNYVFPTFITTRMPIGPGRPDDRGDLRGGDVGQRRRAERAGDGDDHRLLPPLTSSRPSSDAHYLIVSKLATVVWGLFACVVAMYAAQLGLAHRSGEPVRVVLLRSLLGVFILALGFKRATGTGAFFGLIAGIGHRR